MLTGQEKKVQRLKLKGESNEKPEVGGLMSKVSVFAIGYRKNSRLKVLFVCVNINIHICTKAFS